MYLAAFICLEMKDVKIGWKRPPRDDPVRLISVKIRRDFILAGLINKHSESSCELLRYEF